MPNIFVYSPEGSVSDLAKNIASQFGGVYFKSKEQHLPYGRVVVGDTNIFINSTKCPGVSNEEMLYNKVNTYIQDRPIDIKFISENKEVVIRGCKSIQNRSTFTNGRKKADIIIKTRNGEFNLSLKQDNSQMWESADYYYRSKAHSILRSHNDKIKDCGNYYRIEPNIAVKANKREMKDVVFGSDIYGKGAILFKTFHDADFHYSSGKLEINCSRIIQRLKDVKPVYFLIRNDKSRESVKGYPGIRVLAVCESRITKNVHVIS